MPLNNHSQYNKLKIEALETHAFKWAEHYNSDKIIDEDSGTTIDDIVRIQRIVLFKSGLGAPHNIKYVLVFELPQIKDEYKELLWYHKVLQELIECDGGPSFLDEDFFNDVYIKKPKDEPIKQWLFRHTSPDENLQIPEIIPESMIVLFENRIGTDPNIARKSRPCQSHKAECRKVAAKIWENHPEMTIADMIDQAEILKVSKKTNGKAYMEGTVRNWIKDLCPNRSPGRRRRT